MEQDYELSSFFENIRNGKELTSYVSENLQVPPETQSKYNNAVDEVVRFLNSKADYGSNQPRDFPWKFKRVKKSGSLQKGTAVRNRADVDLVCFVERGTTLKEPVEFLRGRRGIIEDIANKFGAYYKWVKEGSHWTKEIKGLPVMHQQKFVPLHNFHNGYLLNLKLVEARGVEDYSLPDDSEELDVQEYDDSSIDIDVIPGFDLYNYLGQTPGKREGRAIYEFIRRQEHPIKFADLFSASLAEMQLDFVADYINKNNLNNLKKLIILIKFWFKTEVQSRYNRVRFPSYLMELLCIHVYQTRLESTKYDILKWFYQILAVIVEKDDLVCYWEEQYRREDIPWEIMEQRPLIVDPANPFNNVAGGVAQWPEVSACAKAFQSMLLKKYGAEMVKLKGASTEVEGSPIPRLSSVSFTGGTVPKKSSVGDIAYSTTCLDKHVSDNFANEEVDLYRRSVISSRSESGPVVPRVQPHSMTMFKSEHVHENAFSFGGQTDKSDSNVSNPFGYLAAGALGAALGAGACYLLAKK